MTNEINIKEFRNHLIKLTKDGNPKIMGSPFCIFEIFNGDNSKPFFGKVGNNKFRITRNSPIMPTPYLIEGNFKVTSSGLDYKIRPIWFGYLWIRIIPLLFIIFFVVLFLNSEMNVSNSNWIGLAVFFAFFSMILFVPVLITTVLKRKMEKKLKQEFEIFATNSKNST